MPSSRSRAAPLAARNPYTECPQRRSFLAPAIWLGCHLPESPIRALLSFVRPSPHGPPLGSAWIVPGRPVWIPAGPSACSFVLSEQVWHFRFWRRFWRWRRFNDGQWLAIDAVHFSIQPKQVRTVIRVHFVHV